MFTTFTGNSRRPRNVNLSGRTQNPFAATTSHSPSAVAQAQHERRARQMERDRTLAAKTLQKHWRGRADRRKVRSRWRKSWDDGMRKDGVMIGREDIHDTWGSNLGEMGETQLRWAQLLARFARWDEGDIPRVCCFSEWLNASRARTGQQEPLSREWEKPILKLANFAISAFDHDMGLDSGAMQTSDIDTAEISLLNLLALAVDLFPDGVAESMMQYYTALGRVAIRAGPLGDDLAQVFSQALTRPLQGRGQPMIKGYEGLLCGLLTIPALQQSFDLNGLTDDLDFAVLAKTLRRLLEDSQNSPSIRDIPKSRFLWLLSFVIYIHDNARSSQSSNIDYIASISILISQLADELGQRPDIHNTQSTTSLPPFVQDEVSSLINQESITGLLANSDFIPSTSANGVGKTGQQEAAVLASYALTLIQVFPRRGDDIHMWLYLGSTSAIEGQHNRDPAIKFFWRAVKHTDVYKQISNDSRKAVDMLRYDRQTDLSVDQRLAVEQQWRVVFLFLELYSFVLRFMDDDEFMAGGEDVGRDQSWTRQSALSLPDVLDLTLFLKNFAFATHWYSAQIMGTNEQVETQSLASYFGHDSHASRFKEALEQPNKSEEILFTGVNGMTVSYMKGMVTGLLRMLYERDSRRHFCPPDQWLMKDFGMKGFIEAVVAEQAYRNQQHERGDEGDAAGGVEDTDDYVDQNSRLVGTSHTQQIRRTEWLKEQQQRALRQKRLENLTPRLEILQNMPFFIPFATRVEIFRQFVLDDQVGRRNGFVDPDQWRMFGGNSSILPSRDGHSSRAEQLSKHSAKVRRDHVFDDAYDQFYELGEGLKEPIQITFVDQFNTVEAGIDGGGVTKEFLTSVTDEAFAPSRGLNLFVENDEHLLFPNPSAMDECKEKLKDFGIEEGSTDWHLILRDLLRKYEFLGRVVGKCLYEGILVDVHFAPFFLVKWALTGGSGSATNESGYRANINDLRDLDEELYQGLLKLKNYPGNVEDFDLDFTITDVVARPTPGSPNTALKTTTRNLRPGGAKTAVTNLNRLIYISAVARHRLQTQPAAQTSAFLRGLSTMIQPAWLSMFNQSELQTLLGGAADAEIDIEDLRKNTTYSGLYEIGDDGLEHPTVALFWETLRESGDVDRRAVLKYVTSTPRAPLLGFGMLNPRFTIRDSGSDEERLPSASTCVNLLKLPVYRQKGVLKEKLLYAVHSGAGFNLS